MHPTEERGLNTTNVGIMISSIVVSSAFVNGKVVGTIEEWIITRWINQ